MLLKTGFIYIILEKKELSDACESKMTKQSRIFFYYTLIIYSLNFMALTAGKRGFNIQNLMCFFCSRSKNIPDFNVILDSQAFDSPFFSSRCR